MKKFIFLFISILIHLTSFSQTASDSTYQKKELKNALKVDDRIFVGYFITTLERYLNSKNSIGLVGGYTNSFLDDDPNYYTLSTHIQYRHYFSKKSNQGLYLGFASGYGFTNNSKTYNGIDPNRKGKIYEEQFRYAYIMGSIGYQLKIKSHWLVEAGVQANYNYWIKFKDDFIENYTSNSYADSYRFLYFQPVIICNVGYLF